MVSAFLASALLYGGRHSQSIEYRPTKNAPFSLAHRLSEMLEATKFGVSSDGQTFSWEGRGTVVTLKEDEGLVRIKTEPTTGLDLQALVQLVDVPVEHCVVQLTMKRDNEEVQRVEADVALGTQVQIGGGFGTPELTARPRRNGDGTYTINCGMSRKFGTEPNSVQRSMTLVVRLKPGVPLGLDGRFTQPARPQGPDVGEVQAFGAGEKGLTFTLAVSPPKGG